MLILMNDRFYARFSNIEPILRPVHLFTWKLRLLRMLPGPGMPHSSLQTEPSSSQVHCCCRFCCDGVSFGGLTVVFGIRILIFIHNKLVSVLFCIINVLCNEKSYFVLISGICFRPKVTNFVKF